LLVNISVFKLSLLKYIVAPSTWSSNTVGTVSRICNAKEGHLITSTLLTSDCKISEAFGELSMLIAFPLPFIWKVVPLHFVMRIDWLISTSISMGAEGDSKFSLPSC
jgi:hypothetical protein